MGESMLLLGTLSFMGEFQVQTWPCGTKQVGNNKLFSKHEKLCTTIQHKPM